MSLTDILVILGCLGAGYWIVSSVMGPGTDVIDAGRKAETKRQEAEQGAATSPPRVLPMRDWHLVLDVPANASRADIQSALKRRLAQAEANADAAGAERIRRAAVAGLAAAQGPQP
ncbi:MAG TPA: hypothetical protein VMK82_01235 [Steroidobacteraceae bacterium]|nr:hypothetical protein [Steroidobacteraceae bacterium]